jgi:hypothetical protein
MRLRCYDGRWAGFAIYGVIMAVVYVVGLPATVLWILWRRRHKLFGSPTDAFVASTRATFGFLYVDYGSVAWWWEVEELLRKLLLSAVVVLIEEGSPLQVTLAVLVSGWAHVLHAQYKPWGAGSALYSLQHGALFVTSFVFLMGLLFKVNGVSSSSGTYTALSGIMVTLCVVFMAAWVAVIVARVVAMWRALRKASKGRRPRSGVEGGDGYVGAGAGAARTTEDGVELATVSGNGGNEAGDGGTAPLRLATGGRRADGFMVVNPLRHVGSRGVAGAEDVHTPVRRDGAPDRHGDAGVLHPRGTTPGVSVSRLQRVLAAQVPVPASTRTIDGPTKAGEVW